MRVLIAGAAGFVGSRLAECLVAHRSDATFVALDNLSRRGAAVNVAFLERLGGLFAHGDVRNAEDLDDLGAVDWVVDCAANPSVLSGIGSGTRQVLAQNLGGTVNLLEKARRDGAGFVFLSTSRVYSVPALRGLPLERNGERLAVREGAPLPSGFTAAGVAESFSTEAPVSLYGASKLAAEALVLEYGATFGVPVWVNRCGVIAGAGQFGRADQGIFAYWVYQWLTGRPLRYVGFGGDGLQVRDLVSAPDLGRLVLAQMASPERAGPRLFNVGGGLDGSLSLRELSAYCTERLGPRTVASEPQTRSLDVPYYVTDSTRARETWGWRPEQRPIAVLDDILEWARANRALVEQGF